MEKQDKSESAQRDAQADSQKAVYSPAEKSFEEECAQLRADLKQFRMSLKE